MLSTSLMNILYDTEGDAEFGVKYYMRKNKVLGMLLKVLLSAIRLIQLDKTFKIIQVNGIKI